MFTKHDVRELLHKSLPQRKELEKIYTLLPKTRCSRRALCCSLLPEMSFLEALSALEQLISMKSKRRLHISKKIMRYFFTNPVEINLCPFLDGNDCLIYQDRFFGCRAYGLWSKRYYEKLSEGSRYTKNKIREIWGKMGVLLPQSVTEFQVPYCQHLERQDNMPMDDEMLMQIGRRIEELSEKFSQWHHLFNQMYFSDLSFFLASLFYGTSETVQLKFDIVSDIVKKGNRGRLDELIEHITDFPGELKRE